MIVPSYTTPLSLFQPLFPLPLAGEEGKKITQYGFIAFVKPIQAIYTALLTTIQGRVVKNNGRPNTRSRRHHTCQARNEITSACVLLQTQVHVGQN